MSLKSENPVEHLAWRDMIRRCTQRTRPEWPRYGGRGIRVCERWLASFANFLADMGRKPHSKHSIDRIDNDGDYEPGNCRWATLRQQMLNRSHTLKTHCKNGHPRNNENVRLDTKNGRRWQWCRACDRANQARARARAKAVRP